MSEAWLSDAPGSTIAGRYRVDGLLGRGGMAAVYRVCDMTSGRAVALKRSYARDASVLAKRRAALEREYYTLAQLAHPHIIDIYDFGIDELGPFYTMELLEGADLHESAGSPWQEVCALLRDVASGLAMLHARGLVHRDISTRNVRRTADGRAKLIDFGAMTTMGVNASIVGTPPFLAPEAFQMQALDARADLFSLGALAYVLLTGRHAYPARTLTELRDVWRTQPAPIARLRPELPAALGNLVEQLLSLDRGGRPSSAAEVIAILASIAGLREDERPEVHRAYLTMPQLVGRDAALVQIRKRMLTLVRGDGASLLLEGVAGSGRSRLLDACALEGKLVGALVLRADALQTAQSGAWSVARAIVSQLLAQLSQLPHKSAEAESALRLSRTDLLESFLASGPREDNGGAPDLPERRLLIRELRDLVLSIARTRRLLILVDDVQRCDEPSVAFLAALAHKTQRHALMLVAAVEVGREQLLSSALRLLRSIAGIVPVPELSMGDSTSLLRSVFGDVAHVAHIAARIHEIARGNPRATLVLAQHLVDTGRAQYADGAWKLPGRLDERDLPQSLASSLESRLRAQSEDALELAFVLAAADGDRLSPEHYAAFSSHGDVRRVFQARGELVASRIIIAGEASDGFRQLAFVPVLTRLTPPSQRRRIHGKLAELLQQQAADPLRIASHLLAAEQQTEAVALLVRSDLDPKRVPLELSQRALIFAEAHGPSPAACLRLRLLVLTKAMYSLEFSAFRRVWPAAMTQLEQASGLAAYVELEDVPAPERLTQALTLTQARHEALPESERSLELLPALRELANLHGLSTTFAVAAIDLPFLHGLPDVTPLCALSPAFELVKMSVAAGESWVRGRYSAARKLYEELLLRLAAKDRAGLDEAMRLALETALRFMLAQLDASSGASIEDKAQWLERLPEMRGNAWQLRQVFSLSQGNLDEARRCMRRAELMRLQDGRDQYLVGMTSTIELLAAAALKDLSGVKAALASMEVLAEVSSGWRPVLAVGRARQQQLQGDLTAALEFVQVGLSLAPPGEHLAFALLAAAHVDVLVDAGALDEAVTEGERYLALCEQHGLVEDAGGVEESLARALIAAGFVDRALPIVQRRIERAEAGEFGGVALGILFEQRASIAVVREGQAAFEFWAKRCADEFGKSKNAALASRFARLLEFARNRNVDARHSLVPALERLSVPVLAEFETIHSRMRECVDDAERARCALTLLLQDVESYGGVLFGLVPSTSATDPALQVLASVPEQDEDPALQAWAERYVKMLRETRSVSTAANGLRSETTASIDGEDEVASRYRDESGREYAVVSLSTDDLRPRLAGVLVFQVVEQRRSSPHRRLVHELAEQLLEPGPSAGASR